MVNVWVGSELGTLRGVSFTTQQNTVITYGEQDKEYEVISLTQANSNTEVYCTLRTNLVNVFNTTENIYVNQYEIKGELLNSFDVGDSFLSCTKSGSVTVWQDDEQVDDFNVGVTDACLRSLDNKIITGGKENDLKLWDLETKKETFSAKNVPRDFLDMRLPVWIKCLSTVKSNNDLVCVGTHYHQYRLYDIRTKRRPMISIDWGELPIQSITARDNDVYLANGKGDIGRLDIRTGKTIGKFHGAVGSVRGLALHGSEPYLASVGLDRYLYVHNINTRQLVHKFYLKTKLNCVFFTDLEIDKKDEDEVDVWDQLETTNENFKQKRQKVD